jgi:hypothetical protein
MSLVEKDQLLTEISRVRAEIVRLQTSIPMNPFDESMVEHLLRSNQQEAMELDDQDNAGAAQWSVPLPVPAELEDPLRLDDLLRASGEVFSGLQLAPLVKGVPDDEWTLRGEFAEGEIGFEAKFQVEFVPRRCVRNVQVMISEHVIDEVKGLVDMVTETCCLRTLVVGLCEFAVMYEARSAAFREITAMGGEDKVEVNSAGTRITVSSGPKSFELEWTCEWKNFGLPSLSAVAGGEDRDAATEFLVPGIRLSSFSLGPGASEDNETEFKNVAGPGFDTLVRLCDGDVAKAVRVLKNAMLA